MVELTAKAIRAAIKSAKRPDYLAIVQPDGEVQHYPITKVGRALVATSPSRMGTSIHCDAEGLYFKWHTGGLRLTPNPGHYVKKRSGGRTVETWKPFTVAARPAVMCVVAI